MNLAAIADRLAADVRRMRFGPPVAYTYRPLDYAGEVHRGYLARWGQGRKEALFLGMNPGPWGMAQTGVPFGAVSWARDWLGLGGLAIGRPAREHPKRPVTGFACRREEVSGARIWGWARASCGTPERFFERFFIGNYIPLLFLDEGARNLTPDKLSVAERRKLHAPCDRALRRLVAALEAPWVIGVGAYAARQARRALEGRPVQVGQILHPSPANPAANRGWATAATQQLRALGLALP